MNDYSKINIGLENYSFWVSQAVRAIQYFDMNLVDVAWSLAQEQENITFCPY